MLYSWLALAWVLLNTAVHCGSPRGSDMLQMSCRINRKTQAIQAKLGVTNLTSLLESDKKVTEGSSNQVQVLPPHSKCFLLSLYQMGIRFRKHSLWQGSIGNGLWFFLAFLYWYLKGINNNTLYFFSFPLNGDEYTIKYGFLIFFYILLTLRFFPSELTS